MTFVVFAQVLEGVPKAIFFGGGTGVSQYVLTHAWAYTLIGCLLAGVFEEVGRYLAFRFLLKRYTNRRDAVASATAGSRQSWFWGSPPSIILRLRSLSTAAALKP